MIQRAMVTANAHEENRIQNGGIEIETDEPTLKRMSSQSGRHIEFKAEVRPQPTEAVAESGERGRSPGCDGGSRNGVSATNVPNMIRSQTESDLDQIEDNKVKGIRARNSGAAQSS